MAALETLDGRTCDECGRDWLGKVPSPDTVHIWYCPWCETTLSERAVVWRVGPNNDWRLIIQPTDRIEDWPWVGPLTPAPKETADA